MIARSPHLYFMSYFIEQDIPGEAAGLLIVNLVGVLQVEEEFLVPFCSCNGIGNETLIRTLCKIINRMFSSKKEVCLTRMFLAILIGHLSFVSDPPDLH